MRQDKKSNKTQQKNKRKDSKVQQNDSPEIPGKGETLEIPGSLWGERGRALYSIVLIWQQGGTTAYWQRTVSAQHSLLPTYCQGFLPCPNASSVPHRNLATYFGLMTCRCKFCKNVQVFVTNWSFVCLFVFVCLVLLVFFFFFLQHISHLLVVWLELTQSQEMYNVKM